MQQNGSFSVPGKRKYESGKFLAQTMLPIVREGGDGSAQRGRSVISTIALLQLHCAPLQRRFERVFAL